MGNKVLVTGSLGLVGSEAVKFYLKAGFHVVGIDNDMRSMFFGPDASTGPLLEELALHPKYEHINLDIRSPHIPAIFKDTKFDLIIHAAAQPSHDYAADHAYLDFTINALATLKLLECFKMYCPEAVFIFCSTNKVYGDRPNKLPLKELESRYEYLVNGVPSNGINEHMSIDACTHSLFGVSKVAADLLVQEYGRNFGLQTGVFRCGCITGPAHQGAVLHGFLNYLVKCVVNNIPYTVFGYKGKQVRDNIHSSDLIQAFDAFYQDPKLGEVYNMGGGRKNECSIIEAVSYILEWHRISPNYKTGYDPTNRVGDHIWYVTDNSKFMRDYPDWRVRIGHWSIVDEIIAAQTKNK